MNTVTHACCIVWDIWNLNIFKAFKEIHRSYMQMYTRPWGPVDSGALWDTWNQPPPILRSNSRSSQFRFWHQTPSLLVTIWLPPAGYMFHLVIETCTHNRQALSIGFWFSAGKQLRRAAFHTRALQEKSVLRWAGAGEKPNVHQLLGVWGKSISCFCQWGRIWVHWLSIGGGGEFQLYRLQRSQCVHICSMLVC